MENYSEIKKLAAVDLEEIDDRKLIINMAIQSSFYLFEQARNMIEENHSTLVFALLRQIYEYLMIFIGLGEMELPVNLFVQNTQGFTGEVYDEFKKKSNERITPDQTISPNDYLNNIHKVLDTHTHAGFDRMMHTSIEIYGTAKGLKMQKQDATIMFNVLEHLFLTCINEYFHVSFSRPTIDLRTFLAIAKKIDLRTTMPEGYFERLNKIPAVSNRNKQTREEIKKYIDYIKSRKI